jgi:hypothetical protein
LLAIWWMNKDFLDKIWALGNTFKLVHCIPLYSMTFPKLKNKTWKNLTSFELVAAFFCNWGFYHRMDCPHSQYHFIRALQSLLFHLLEQTYFDHVTWTISIYMSSPHGFKSLSLMIWSSTQYDSS